MGKLHEQFGRFFQPDKRDGRERERLLQVARSTLEVHETEYFRGLVLRWQKLAEMTSDDIRKQKVWPKGFLPL